MSHIRIIGIEQNQDDNVHKNYYNQKGIFSYFVYEYNKSIAFDNKQTTKMEF